jgi:hypothetical protein
VGSLRPPVRAVNLFGMGFELFDSTGQRHGAPQTNSAPFVTVTNSANLLVNRWATDELGNPPRVLLYFDRERRMAGMRGVEAAPHSYRATPRANGRQFTVGCVGFVREFKIADGRFPAAMEDGMLVFEVGPAGGRFLDD